MPVLGHGWREGPARRRARRESRPVETENQVLHAIVQFLAYKGVRLHRIRERIPEKDAAGRVLPWTTGTVGIPDLIGYILAGRLGLPKSADPVPVYIEVKRPGGRCRPRQVLFVRGLVDDGVLAFFASSIDDVVREFNARGYEMSDEWGSARRSSSDQPGRRRSRGRRDGTGW